MKRIELIFFTILVLIIPNDALSQQGWFPLTSGTNDYLTSIYFTTNLTGYAVGSNNSIIKTTNSGINWTYQSVQGSYNSIYFIDPNTGYSVGVNVSFTVSLIIKTTNAGISWVNHNPGTGNRLYSVYFPNVNTGYVSGQFGLILKTTNSGVNWFQQSSGTTTNSLECVHFLNSNTGFIAGGFTNSSILLKTTNGGINWIPLTTNVSDRWLSMSFLDTNIGYVTGVNGSIIKTTNSGVNWIIQNSGSNTYLDGVHFININTGYISGWSGVILKTTNGGENWESQFSGTNRNLESIYFIDSVTAFTAGQDGTILKTTNGGITPIEQTGNIIFKDFLLYQNYPNPFNPNTNIQFNISNSTFTKLTIYDVTGGVITILVNEELRPGVYEVDWDASNKASGIYYYKLETQSFTETKRMVLLK
jgi:photosystem II stability/assembly factor-like uncharacterized protein